MSKFDPRNRTAYESGAVDAYYHRYNPHLWRDTVKVISTELTGEERQQYDQGHTEAPYGEKDWGESWCR